MVEVSVWAVTVWIFAALFLCGAVAWHAVDVLGSRRLMTRKKVLVNLRSGNAMTGVMWSRRGRHLVLKSAQLIEPGADAVPMDGDVVLDRDQVEFVQVAGS